MSADQKLTSNTDSTSPDVNADEDDFQKPDCDVVESDVSLAYPSCTNTQENASYYTLSSAFKASVFSDEDSPADDFITVQYSRRPYGQATKPTETAPDPHTQLREQPPHGTVTIAETQGPLKTTVTRPAAMVKTASNLQPIYPHASPKTHGNATLSKVDVSESSTCFALEECPVVGEASSQKPAQNSGNPSDAGNDNFKPHNVTEPPSIKQSFPSTLQRFPGEESTRKPSTEELAPTSSQEMTGRLISSSSTGSPHSWTTKPGHSESYYVPLTLTPNFQTKAMSRKRADEISLESSDPRRIPEGVYVVCDHFLRENRIQCLSNSGVIKTCRSCADHGLLKYAAWNNINRYWQEMRPYPAYRIPPNATLDMCRHFSTNRPCPKEPCTFPHGKLESTMWSMERQGGGFESR